jgi:plastocyanin
MSGDIFYVFGIVLVIAAVAASFVGIRGAASFPPNRGILVGVIGLFVAMVAVTLAFAIDLSEEEQSHREEELAHEGQQAAEGTTTAPSQGTATAPGGGGTTATAPQGGGPTQTLDFSTPSGTALAYDQKNASTNAGSVTVDFQNNQVIAHDVAIQDSSGQIIGQTDLVANGSASTTVNLTPGNYTFFCTVPGHREAGMVGLLNAK